MSWDTYKALTFDFPEVSLSLDLSRLGLPEGYIDSQRDAFAKAFAAMDELESGAIANPDEGRMVGHYWLRDAALAPTDELKETISSSVDKIKAFAAKVHSGALKGANGPFTDILVIGIGGSALGPQFIAHALGVPSEDKAQVHFFDNTDPDGMDLALNAIGDRLGSTLSLVISKSGGTAETRNGMLEAQKAYADMGLDFAKHAVAITGVDSKLDKVAVSEGWLERFEMWDWVGGRTSVLCAVGLVAAALQGIDIQALLDGAAAMDKVTRAKEIEKNPAALLALAWFFATNGKGEKDMVILPYKDRLLLFSRYLQQLIMESLGKEFDLDGNVVNQGIAVYGNKGSTDQHAYVQQLREGVPNFFATFIEVLKDRNGPSIEVEPGVTAGDYLQGFLLGTREALGETGRQSITLTTAEINEGSVANLIALYERAVGYYATLTNINAYHQPGVEAGKKAAGAAIELAKGIVATLEANKGSSLDAPAIAEKLGKPESTELVYKIALHMAANAKAGISKIDGAAWHEAKFLIMA
ncbi:glucose-6-phosphate isomerase [Pelagicoccus sp. SDUM812003]|uniref:glucose-6-phosphate isomerase n=1 Tax=Pelagicoccus sp. SDUM812003 TaxID=3041267 RepID=UPI00280CBA15|nr:glucose-6-phosphate isomerase [Pelagicoccus sp. SDUM812003]MDQ8205150.1 glucose-6-phosphate isomerase [Pelagicoccus sp. SDUM812003]